MTKWHGYMGVENLGLNTAQRQILIDELKTLGPGPVQQPNKRMHWRTRLDEEAVILETVFDEDNLTIAKFKQRLATIYGVDVSEIGDASTNQSFGGHTTPVVTFSYSATDRLRVAIFGGPSATWQESGDEAREYLILNNVEWESE